MNIWQTIQSEIQDATQAPSFLSEKISVSGGDMNQAFRLTGHMVANASLSLTLANI